MRTHSSTADRRRQAGRRHPLASVALIAIGLLTTGGAYALMTTTASAETTAASQQSISEGQKIFAANCATCHGMSAAGTKLSITTSRSPSLSRSAKDIQWEMAV